KSRIWQRVSKSLCLVRSSAIEWPSCFDRESNLLQSLYAERTREAVRKIPFEPFWIDLSSGTEIPLPHPDHVWVREQCAVVENDKGTVYILSPQHIARNRANPRRDYLRSAYLCTCKRNPACHPDRSAVESKDPAKILMISHRDSSTSLALTENMFRTHDCTSLRKSD